MMPVASFVSVTLAFGITAPLESRTVPEISDVDVCARLTLATRSKDINSAQRTVGCRMIIHPPAQKLYTTNHVPGGEISATRIPAPAPDCRGLQPQRDR